MDVEEIFALLKLVQRARSMPKRLHGSNQPKRHHVMPAGRSAPPAILEAYCFTTAAQRRASGFNANPEVSHLSCGAVSS